jgi:hypothetical protein
MKRAGSSGNCHGDSIVTACGSLLCALSVLVDEVAVKVQFGAGTIDQWIVRLPAKRNVGAETRLLSHMPQPCGAARKGITMHKCSIMLATVVGIALALPASAQQYDDHIPSGGLAANEAECVAQFQAADLNGDNILSAGEIRESRSLLPPEFVGEHRILRQEFLSTCHANITANRQGG